MIYENLKKVLEKIEEAKSCYNRKDFIELIAVSKYSNAESIKEAFNCGQSAFGENKVQDLIQKQKVLNNQDIKWHFIGTLQENKINSLLLAKPILLHSLHSLKLAHALQKRLIRDGKKLRALLQINSANEDSKHGFDIESALDCYIEIMQTCPNIELSGLMCMGANSNNKAIIEKSFLKTQGLFEKLKPYNANILSMGMSSDYEIAIACGSTCLRIGSSIFK